MAAEEHLERWQEEVLACRDDSDYFWRRYLPVRDRDDPAKVVRFKARFHQHQVLDAMRTHGVVMVLKFRRAGVSRVVMSELLHAAHWRQLPVISCFHNEKDAIDAFQQVRQWYFDLPPFMKQGPYELVTNRRDLLEWKHGGAYRVTWDGAKPAGTYTWDLRHYSETGKYKNSETMDIIEGGVSKYGRQIQETTADGLGLAFTTWDSNNGIHKLFLEWPDDPGYRMSDSEAERAGYKSADVLTEPVLRYAKQYGLDREQQVWMGIKLKQMAKEDQHSRGLMRRFHSEFPATPQLAFQSAAGRVFPTLHFHDTSRQPGLMVFEGPNPYRVYALGVDVAAGTPTGDYSTISVVDWSKRDQPRLVASFYDRVNTTDLKAMCFELGRNYGGGGFALLAVERNGMGMSFIDNLVESGYGNLYVEEIVAKVEGGPTTRIGFQTGDYSKHRKTQALKYWLEDQKMPVPCRRIRYEINNVTYNEREQMEAVKPFHDDGLDGLALALLCGDQTVLDQQETLLRKPTTNAEWRAYREVIEERPELEGRFAPDWFDELLGGSGGNVVSSSVFDGLSGRR